MAGFPAGTLSGAPKVRAMEIIDELEKEKRGPYAGCVGYFSADGEMDTCIVLRTALVKDGTMYVQAGAGVVADSVPGARAGRMREQGPRPVQAAEEAVRFAARAQARPVSMLTLQPAPPRQVELEGSRHRPITIGRSDHARQRPRRRVHGQGDGRARPRPRPRALLDGAAHARHA